MANLLRLRASLVPNLRDRLAFSLHASTACRTSAHTSLRRDGTRSVFSPLAISPESDIMTQKLEDSAFI